MNGRHYNYFLGDVRWGDAEPVRKHYGPDAVEPILSAWTRVRGGTGWIANFLMLNKFKPRASVFASAWRGVNRPALNYIRLRLQATQFSTPDGGDRIVRIAQELVAWSCGVYARAWHSDQSHRRIAAKTPEERLEQMDWLAFFGEPFLELFGGRQRVLDAPCYLSKETNGGVLLLAAPRPDGPEMTHSEATLLKLERYLGIDAFAGNGYPDVPCRVPHFDLSETVVDRISSDVGG